MQQSERALERLDARGVLAEPLVRADEQPSGRVRLLDLERALGHGGERLPLLRGRQALAEREQRLVRAFGLAVQAAHGREQVLDGGAGRRLLEPRRAFIAHPHRVPGEMRIDGELLDAGAELGTRRETARCVESAERDREWTSRAL